MDIYTACLYGFPVLCILLIIYWISSALASRDVKIEALEAKVLHYKDMLKSFRGALLESEKKLNWNNVEWKECERMLSVVRKDNEVLKDDLAKSKYVCHWCKM